MDQLYKNQIKQIVSNLHNKSGKIPFMSDLLDHPVFGPAIHVLSFDEKKEVGVIIDSYIEHYVASLTTKGGQLFRRLFEQYTDDFREYRVLNQDKNNIHMPRFQSLSQFFQKELFALESVLTSKMLKRPEGLDKVIDSFYDIVDAIFPLHGSE
jgi:succinate dehydrogenase flavin-adding protein (antitoxin of CptAB toxin-antitoxin module)